MPAWAFWLRQGRHVKAAGRWRWGAETELNLVRQSEVVIMTAKQNASAEKKATQMERRKIIQMSPEVRNGWRRLFMRCFLLARH